MQYGALYVATALVVLAGCQGSDSDPKVEAAKARVKASGTAPPIPKAMKDEQ